MGSQNYTIYKEYIDSDLTWFPVTISTSDIPSGYFAGFTDFSDDFNGSDDSVADVRYWFDNVGTYTIQNNKIRSGQATGSAHDLNFNFRAIGNFDMQVDYDRVLGPDVAGWGYDLTAQQDNGVTMGSTRARSGDGQGYRTWYNPGTGGAWTSLTSKDDSSGKLRLTRIGIQWTSYYWDSGWQQIHQMNQTSAVQDVFLNFRAQSWNVPPIVQVDFDNFIITADKLIPKNPEKTTYFTDTDGNILYTEVEHVDFTNELATFHTAVPTVTAETDTPLTLNWDWEGRDYSVRELPVTDYSDSFTGANGSSPDTIKWKNIGSNTTIQSNQLNQPIAAGFGNSGTQVTWDFDGTGGSITGNFDVQVDYDLITFPNSSYWGAQLVVGDTDGEGCSHVVGWYGRQQYWTWVNNDGWKADIPSHNSGKLRVTRVGTTWTALHWDGNAWQTNYSWDPGTAAPIDTLHLYIRHGDTKPACEVNFDNFKFNNVVYDLTEVGDTFTGNDGDAPDILKWEVSVGTPTIQSNKLNMITGSGQTSEFIASKYNLVDDFDIQVDWDIPSAPGVVSYEHGLRLYSNVNKTQHIIVRREHAGQVAGFSFDSSYHQIGMVPTAVLSGKFRVTRVGSTVTLYYDIGAGWASFGTDSFDVLSTDDVTITFVSGVWDTQPDFEGNYDNLQINSADSITGWTEDTGEFASQQVWDDNFKIVSHLADTPTGSANDILDSTSNEYHGTSYNMGAGNSGSNEFGRYMSFDGNEEFIDFGDAFYSDILTLESVINPTVVNDYDALLHKRNAVGTVTKVDPPEWEFSIQPTGNIRLVGWQDNSNFIQVDSSTANLVAGVENYVAGAFPGNGNGNAVVHLNDSENGNATHNKTIGNRASGIQVASRTNEVNTRWWGGDIREIRISNSFRSEAWRKATYYSLNGEIWGPLIIPDETLTIQGMAVVTSAEQIALFAQLIIQNLNILTSTDAANLIPYLNINDLNINTDVGKMMFWEALSTINNSIEFRTLLRTLISRTPKYTIESKTLKRILRQLNE